METDVSKTPLTYESYERVKKDILTGSVPSGSVPSERALAERNATESHFDDVRARYLNSLTNG